MSSSYLEYFPGESGEIDQRKSFVGFLGLYSLYVQIFRQVDKKFIKQIWEVHRKVRMSNRNPGTVPLINNKNRR